MSFCTDNGAMIAYLGELKFRYKSDYSLKFSAIPNLKLTKL